MHTEPVDEEDVAALLVEERIEDELHRIVVVDLISIDAVRANDRPGVPRVADAIEHDQRFEALEKRRPRPFRQAHQGDQTLAVFGRGDLSEQLRRQYADHPSQRRDSGPVALRRLLRQQYGLDREAAFQSFSQQMGRFGHGEAVGGQTALACGPTDRLVQRIRRTRDERFRNRHGVSIVVESQAPLWS